MRLREMRRHPKEGASLSAHPMFGEVVGFGPNPDRGTYEVRRCDYCATDRLCRHDGKADMWLCNGREGCYKKRWLLRGRKARGESLR